MKPWIKTIDRRPPENVFVETKIDDEDGVRNVQKLKRKGVNMFCADGMYVYYTPTHWRRI